MCDGRNHTVRRIDKNSGIIMTVAGSGRQGYSGDGGSATEAALNNLYSLQVYTQRRYLHRRPAERRHPQSRGRHGHHHDGGWDRRTWLRR